MSAEQMQQALLAFFDREQRDLPWRRDRDPYRIWISEVMLQQTQVVTVVPYFLDFIDAFPNVEVLAAASLDAVLARWSGLGYYRRARQLHQAAKLIAQSGYFPTNAAAWQNFPGIGPYTAAAIASQAFGEVVPVLDGNVERVLCRRLGLAEDPKRRQVRSVLLTAAAGLLDSERPGDSNQALMELGATLCRPREPLCLSCPLAEGCRGKGDPERYPSLRPQRATEKLALVLALVRRESKLLFFRRPANAPFLGGMWELPNVPVSQSLEQSAASLGEAFGGSFVLGAKTKRLRHSITYRRLEIDVHEAEWQEGSSSREFLWADGHERRALGLSSMFEKALKP